MHTLLETRPDALTEAHVARPAVEPSPAETVIGPQAGWQVIDVGELWRHRELFFFLCWRDVTIRYKQMVLGAAWAVLQPALMMVVFTIFFGRMANVPAGDGPYPLFVLCGLLPWTFFAAAITNAGNSVVGSERLITKIYFPRLAIPFASVGAAGIDFAISCGLLAVLMVWYGAVPPANLLVAVPVVALIAVLALGVGTMLAALNVAYRDFRYITPFLVQIGLFATPTIYMNPPDADGRLHSLLALNPLVPLIAAFRACVMGGPIPWAGVGIAAGVAVAALLAGVCYFRSVEDGFADVI